MSTSEQVHKWLALPRTERKRLAHDAWCSVGAQQGYCSSCGIGFRGLGAFDRGFRAGVTGCLHPELIAEGDLHVLEWREVDGVHCPRAGDLDTRQNHA